MRAGTIVERLAVPRIELENSPEDGVRFFLPAVAGIPLGQPAEQDDVLETRLELPGGNLDDVQRSFVASVHLAEFAVQPREISPRIVVVWPELRGPPIPGQRGLKVTVTVAFREDP